MLRVSRIPLLILAMCATECYSGEKVFSVCEALASREELDGKLSAIRGRVEAGSEGAWLTMKCRTNLSSAAHQWPNAISLAYALGNEPLHEITFQEDERAMKQFDSKARKILKTSGCVTGTYVGLFETYRDLASRVRVGSNGQTLTQAFGHLGSSPAQLVVKSARDPRPCADER